MEHNFYGGDQADRRLRPSFGKAVRGILCLVPMLLSADTIYLKSGQTLIGTSIGATNRDVRIAVGDTVQKIAISDIARVILGVVGCTVG